MKCPKCNYSVAWKAPIPPVATYTVIHYSPIVQQQCDVTYLSPQLSLILAVGNSNRSLSSLLDVITEKRSRQTPSSILGLHNGHNGFGGLVCLVMLACLQSGKCSRIVLCSSRFIWSTFPSEFRL